MHSEAASLKVKARLIDHDLGDIQSEPESAQDLQPEESHSTPTQFGTRMMRCLEHEDSIAPGGRLRNQVQGRRAPSRAGANDDEVGVSHGM